MRSLPVLPAAAGIFLTVTGFVWFLTEPAAGVPAAALNSASAPVFAQSMQGTRPDGQLTIRHDQLQVDPELLYLFDYYLSAQGEKPLPQILEAIRAELRQRLQPSSQALAQAEQLLNRYLDYKKALLALEKAENSSETKLNTAARLRARLSRLHQLRVSMFSEKDALALFALEEMRDADAVRRMEIFEDTKLSLAEKQQAYARLDANLPARLKEEREAPQRIQNVEQQVAQMRASGASEQDVYQFRAMQFSADAAYRLQELDREEQQWANRIQLYQQALRQALQLPDGPLHLPAVLTPSQQIALQSLRNQFFSPQEQQRLAAYEGRS
ncbi:lipase secretion chaperone [Undibacterium luofuense]|uniref:Lipase helper protein n=1 Tax=Undibacterium luofuense TaxID=2828733 RepID=A0A941DJC2_9BURK|nr:lipase secretion chaperone [Undibacterium luofuense]MBR7781818.1 lipase chaperone [Undibacterium luofuense]